MKAARQRRPRAVFLVGFMGAGKTSVGRELARRLGWPFLDLDDLVEARERRTIAQIFESSGEPAFRQAESAALAGLLLELDEQRPLIAALGGGAFAQLENIAALEAAGEPIVLLDAPVEVLRERCRAMGDARPLFRDAEGFRRLYETRRPLYLRARWHVDTAGRSGAEVADEVLRRLALGPEVRSSGR